LPALSPPASPRAGFPLIRKQPLQAEPLKKASGAP
jgi:hypothetical protein